MVGWTLYNETALFDWVRTLDCCNSDWELVRYKDERYLTKLYSLDGLELWTAIILTGNWYDIRMDAM